MIESLQRLATAEESEAFELGKQAGHAAGSWVFDGNTSEAEYRRVLDGYEAGDPEIMDLEPSPLSGEWADSWTPRSLGDELGVIDTEDRDYELRIEAISDAYEQGFSESFWDEVTRAARYQLDFPESPIGRYVSEEDGEKFDRLLTDPFGRE